MVRRGRLEGVVNVNDFDYSMLEGVKLVPRKRGQRKKYYDLVCAFDIETTNIDKYKQSIMYIWQFQIDDKVTVIGRYWSEFVDFYNRLNDIFTEANLVVLVHNLSFEFQWLKSVIPIDKVFAMSDRKVLYFLSGSMEFRCTYLHSNMSLEKYLEKMNVQDKKVKGFDYKKKRYAWTELTDDELLYCINDVRGLVQAYKYEMLKDGDTLITVPYTSTGYVRRIFKKSLTKGHYWIKSLLPDLEVFNGLRHAFRGGNTHANRYNANRLLENVYSYDISSSYPAVLLTEKYPMQFKRRSTDKLKQSLRLGKACLIHLYMRNVRLKDDAIPIPYIAKGKCIICNNAELDNGRVLGADIIELWITEIDLKIIVNQYDFDYQVLDLFIASKRRLPKVFIKLLFDMYKNKTMLKGAGDDYSYNKYKNMVNSVYGLTVQNPCKEHYDFIDGVLDINRDETMEDLIRRYQRKGWLPYQWGVWCTAYARLKLQEGIDAIPKDNIVYVDTDSVKFIGDYGKRLEELNKKYLVEEYGAPDRNGEVHYIGIYENETRKPYKYFKTLGAKKYAYVDSEGELHITVSGVLKKEGAKELGDIHNFKEGFVFREAGGQSALYNDDPEPKKVHIQGREVDIISNVALFDSTYTLGLTQEYDELLKLLMSSDIKYSMHLYDEVD